MARKDKKEIRKVEDGGERKAQILKRRIFWIFAVKNLLPAGKNL